MTPVRRPSQVPELTPQPGARSVASGVRTCGVVMSDASEVMRASSAPEGFEGDPAEIFQHAMTGTARDLESATAALRVGLAALDVFCDRMDALRTARTDLETRRHTLQTRATELEARAADEDADDDSALGGDISRHNVEVTTFDTDVETWRQDVTDAEDRLITTLRSADTTAEAVALSADSPDVPGLVQHVEGIADDPHAVHTWWISLSPQAREALKMAHPGLIGNLDGIPVADRDEANRAGLSALHNQLRQQQEDGEELSDGDADLLDKTSEMYQALGAAEDQIDANGDPVPAHLMIFDPEAADGDGHAAVAFGNPETADHVSVNIPGLGSTMNNFDGVAGDAATVREAAARQSDGTVASIAYLGYDAPDFSGSVDGVVDGLGVAGEGAADRGATNLSHFVDGLRETYRGDGEQQDPRAHVTVVGHSYGSVTTGIAAGDGMDADDVVLVGSPGAGDANPTADHLTGNVYIGASDEDFVTRLGTEQDVSLGVDPASEGFGGVRFRVDEQGEFTLSPSGFERGAENHTSYFDDKETMEDEGRGTQDSASLANIAKVVAGHGGDVERHDPRTESNEAWWLRQAGEDARNGLVDWFNRRAGIG
ncbi:alpha/beta hydrolase [Aeromicrobium sp. CF4.19]|uniref:alpha/beta hydrolase n=1 Tax=Aeromicrobium sp. CF4.19 TaxID=3373082 RepID=UPI003EE74E0D